jgi:branched-chain amino acid transport system substrate-binding protein
MAKVSRFRSLGMLNHWRRSAIVIGTAITMMFAGWAGVASGTSDAAGASAPGVTAHSVTVGLITPLSGPAASTFTSVKTGFDARIALQNAKGGVDGRKIVVVPGDDQGTPTGSLSIAQTLVEQKNVFAVAEESPLDAASAQYLTSNKIPVVGNDDDGGKEWTVPTNSFFASFGSQSLHLPAPASWGTFLKQQGATKLAGVGCSLQSCSADIDNAAASAKHAGVQSVYVNTTIPLTQTGGFQGVAQAIKASGADSVILGMTTTSGVALVQALQQEGITLKVEIILPAVPAAVLANSGTRSLLQGTWTPVQAVPYQIKTPGTKIFVAALKKYGHQSPPAGDINEYYGWADASGIIKGLQVAGENPTRQSFISNLRKVTSFNAGGLAITPVNFVKSTGTGAAQMGPAPQDCVWFLHLKGDQFVPQPKAICGGLVPGSNAG